MKSNHKLIFTLCRIVLGAVFVFSGGMKCIDSWGWAQKVGEYLTAFDLEWLMGLRVAMAVAFCALELTMGLMLVFNVRPKLTSTAALVFMVGFTLLTLGMAIWNPLDDCGCFGEALRMSNWNSFFKNVVLLTLSILVWRECRGGTFFGFTRRETLWTVIFAAVALILGIGVYRHLPPVDMFPLRKGVNLREDVLCTACIDNETTLIYKDISTGQEREFALSDTTWYDSSKWEYVATRSALDDLTTDKLEEDFALFDGGTNVADSVVDYEGMTVLVVMRDLNNIDPKCFERLENFVKGQQSGRIFVVTEEGRVSGAEYESPDFDAANDESSADSVRLPAAVIDFGGRQVGVLTMGNRALGYLLRADAGIVTIENGIITGKKNCRDVK